MPFFLVTPGGVPLRCGAYFSQQVSGSLRFCRGDWIREAEIHRLEPAAKSQEGIRHQETSQKRNDCNPWSEEKEKAGNQSIFWKALGIRGPIPMPSHPTLRKNSLSVSLRPWGSDRGVVGIRRHRKNIGRWREYPKRGRF